MLTSLLRLWIKDLQLSSFYEKSSLAKLSYRRDDPDPAGAACRFNPTFSDYSIEAMRRHGTIRRLILTHWRLNSRTNDVPMATIDEVPE